MVNWIVISLIIRLICLCFIPKYIMICINNIKVGSGIESFILTRMSISIGVFIFLQWIL